MAIETGPGQLELAPETREQKLARNLALDLEIKALEDRLTKHNADGAKIKADIKAKEAEKADLVEQLEGGQMTLSVVTTAEEAQAEDDGDYPSDEELAAMDAPTVDEAELDRLMGLPWNVEVEFSKEDDCFMACIRELKCASDGMTEEKARESIREALRSQLESMLADGVPIPEPGVVGERPDEAEEGECIGGFMEAGGGTVPFADAPSLGESAGTSEEPDTTSAADTAESSAPAVTEAEEAEDLTTGESNGIPSDPGIDGEGAPA